VVGSNVGSSLPLYWDSPDAVKLFGFSYKNGDDVYTGLQQIIEKQLINVTHKPPKREKTNLSTSLRNVRRDPYSRRT